MCYGEAGHYTLERVIEVSAGRQLLPQLPFGCDFAQPMKVVGWFCFPAASCVQTDVSTRELTKLRRLLFFCIALKNRLRSCR